MSYYTGYTCPICGKLLHMEVETCWWYCPQHPRDSWPKENGELPQGCEIDENEDDE